jgi:HD superfamily phosphohydrolase YqeK
MQACYIPYRMVHTTKETRMPIGMSRWGFRHSCAVVETASNLTVPTDADMISANLAGQPHPDRTAGKKPPNTTLNVPDVRKEHNASSL